MGSQSPAQRSKWPVFLVAVVGVAVLAFSAYLLAAWPPEPPEAGLTVPDEPRTPGRAETAASSAAGAGIDLAVIADEFTAPSEASAGPEWPQILGEGMGWDVTVDAEDGIGYLAPGGGDPFGERVRAVARRSPDVVVVAVGENDLGRYSTAEITAAAGETTRVLAKRAPGAEVVLVSPFSKGVPGPLTTELTEQLRLVAEENGVAFVDASDWLVRSDELWGSDPAHPNDRGQAVIAENMRAELDRLGLG